MKVAIIALLASAVCVAGDDVPGWVRDAAALPVKPYSPKVAAVTLLKEEQVSADPDGRLTMREREVTRTLQRGRNALPAGRSYNRKSGRILDFEAWLIAPSGRTTSIPKSAFADISLSSRYEYSDDRVRLVDPGSLEPGSIFAWEATEEEKTDFTQYQYRFQDVLPVLVSRFILSLPPGWEVKGTPINREKIEPQVAGNTYTWELRDLPWIEPEDYSPDGSSLVPRLGINYFPAADSRAALRPLRNWSATSVWLSGLADPANVITEAIRVKAAELTRGANNELEKIRAIAVFTQATNYMSVDLNIERGGGYAPHAADDTLARNYGDCKDKAALMRALLEAAGIKAFVTSIYSGGREFVRPEWPSSLQFNHAIIAISVSPETRAPSVFQHPRLGRLLMFDPTDDSTPLGNIPEDEQGSHALVLAGQKGELITMPDLPGEMNRTESAYEGRLELNGRLSAHLDRHYFGQAAGPMRHRLKSHDTDSLTRLLEAAFAQRLGGLSMEHVETTDHLPLDRLEMKLDLHVRQFGQFMQKKLLVVSPGSLVADTGYAFPAEPRSLPIQLEAEFRDDKVNFTFPPQFTVDELPDPVKIDSPYGTYRATWKVAGGQVSFEHSLKVNRVTAPASEYALVRAFFDQVDAGQHSPIVLVSQ